MRSRVRAQAIAVVALALGVTAGVTACGGGSDLSLGRPTPPADVVKGWASKWCEAQPGITKEELFRIMGSPTSKFPDQASWEGYEWQFNAFFDVNGHVRQLDINEFSLSSAEKAALQCSTTRVVA